MVGVGRGRGLRRGKGCRGLRRGRGCREGNRGGGGRGVREGKRGGVRDGKGGVREGKGGGRGCTGLGRGSGAGGGGGREEGFPTVSLEEAYGTVHIYTKHENLSMARIKFHPAKTLRVVRRSAKCTPVPWCTEACRLCEN